MLEKEWQRPRDVDGFPLAKDDGAFVLRHDFDNAELFLRALHPYSGFWFDSPTAWVFRGHADAGWPLLPSAHRREPWVPFRSLHAAPFVPDKAKESERLHQEHGLVRAFASRADLLGLHLPGPLPAVPFARWPEPEDIPVTALAQHYGIPTRLLDWTRQGRIAAYFAALDAPSVGEDLAVWALNARFIRNHGGWLEAEPRDLPPLCFVATAPRASNPYLHAQSGVFTYTPFLSTLVSLDEVVAQIVERGRRSGEEAAPDPEPCVLRKFLLPRRAASSLMGLLHGEGVSALTVFPGFSGIAPSMREELQLGMLAEEF
jgi:hypothetical protein